MSDKITMTVKICRNTEYEETNKRADGSEYTVTKNQTDWIFEQTVSDLDVAEVVAVVNKLIKKPQPSMDNGGSGGAGLTSVGTKAAA